MACGSIWSFFLLTKTHLASLWKVGEISEKWIFDWHARGYTQHIPHLHCHQLSYFHTQNGWVELLLLVLSQAEVKRRTSLLQIPTCPWLPMEYHGWSPSGSQLLHRPWQGGTWSWALRGLWREYQNIRMVFGSLSKKSGLPTPPWFAMKRVAQGQSKAEENTYKGEQGFLWDGYWRFQIECLKGSGRRTCMNWGDKSEKGKACGSGIDPAVNLYTQF